MADYKISQLTQVTPPPAGALVPIVDVTDTTTVPAGPGGSNKAMLAGLLSISRVASTFTAGYALVNGTGTIISWTTPNDGALHRVAIFGSMDVTVNEVGGLISVTYTLPDGLVSSSHSLWPAGQTTGDDLPSNTYLRLVKANTTVSIIQSSALTGGTATLWAEIWGS